MARRCFVGALWVSTMLFAQAIGAAPNATGAPSLACSTELQPLVQAERWADLERSARELATRLQARLGAATPEVVRAANCVIVALKAQNRSGEAQAIAQHQIYAATVLTGAHSFDTITAEGSMSDSLLALHRPADAEALLRAALKTHEAALGPNHELIAVSLTQLSTVLKVERRFADAEQLMQRAVSIEEKLPGPERPELANYVTLLAGTQISQGHFAGADLLLQRAIAINERVMGVDSMATAVSLQDAATMTLQEGRYADTEQLYRRMLGISHKLPVLVFADPNFARPKVAKKPELVAAARSLAAYFRDGVPIAEELDDVPSLPGTRVEGEAIVRALKGQPGSLLTGNDASKEQLMRRNADGRLSRVRVLEFATHGLVAGDASDLAEPALVLAAGATPSDELLLASEASQLKLNADWVLLSACNTASPDAPEAQGLSGLSRAFFYAARSLLVSHWRVRDDVAPMLIPAMLMAEREHPEMSRAQALQMATLAVLDNRALNAADPAAWAPFTLIGEAAR